MGLRRYGVDLAGDDVLVTVANALGTGASVSVPEGGMVVVRRLNGKLIVDIVDTKDRLVEAHGEVGAPQIEPWHDAALAQLKDL